MLNFALTIIAAVTLSIGLIVYFTACAVIYVYHKKIDEDIRLDTHEYTLDVAIARMQQANALAALGKN